MTIRKFSVTGLDGFLEQSSFKTALEFAKKLLGVVAVNGKLGPMLYKVGDIVNWSDGTEKHVGEIIIADFGGSLEMLGEQHSYDIRSVLNGKPTLVKHIPEAWIKQRLSTKLERQKGLEELRAKAAHFDDDASRTEFDPEDGLNMATPDGYYEFETYSGSRYQVAIHGKNRQLIRKNATAAMRQDGAAIEIIYMEIIPGRSGYLVLEPLGEGEVTTRLTSQVVRVWRIEIS